MCKLAGISREQLKTVKEAIIDQAMDGRVVMLKDFAKIWIVEHPPCARRVVNYKTHETRLVQFPTSYRLRFKVSANLRKVIRLRLDGRVAGTEVLV